WQPPSGTCPQMGAIVVVVVEVDVVVDVVGVPPNSTAPMSHRTPCGRETSRWSSASQAGSPLPGAAGFPASMSGLPGSGAWVGVGPPLSCKGPRLALTPVTLPLVSPPT